METVGTRRLDHRMPGGLAMAVALFAIVLVPPARAAGATPEVTYIGPGKDEIILQQASPSWTSTYYLLSLSLGEHPFSAEPSVGGSQFFIDSGSRRVFLTLQQPSQAPISVTGVFPESTIRLAAGRASITLTTPLKTTASSADIGSLKVTLGVFATGSRLAVTPSYALYLKAGALSSTLGALRSQGHWSPITFVAMSKPKQPAKRPAGTTFKGRTGFGALFTVTTDARGLAFVKFKLGEPPHPCANPGFENGGGWITGQTFGPITPGGAFTFVYSQPQEWPSGAPAGYEKTVVLGHFLGARRIVGAFSTVDYVALSAALELGADTTSTYDSTFTASASQ